MKESNSGGREREREKEGRREIEIIIRGVK